jgi:hypothetical protein
VTPGYLGGQVGVRFIRISDGAILYRYFGYLEVYSGYRDASLRRADVANAWANSTAVSGRAGFHVFVRAAGDDGTAAPSNALVSSPFIARGASPARDERRASSATVRRARRSFGVLRRRARSGDRAPAGVRRSPFAGRFAGRGATRRARGGTRTASARAAAVFVTPTADGVCAQEASGAGSCAPLADARAGRLVVAADSLPGTAPGTVRVIGLAPDGVAEVTLTLADGTALTERVVGNTYVFDVGAAPASIGWTRGDRETTVGVPYVAE